MRARVADDLGHVVTEGAAARAAGVEAFANPGFGAIPRIVASGSPTLASPLAAIVGPHGDVLDRGGDPGDTVARRLADELFADANHEGDGVYRVPPALVCGDDTACRARVERAQLRVRVELADGELRGALQVGAERDEPVTFALAHESLVVTLDLDHAAGLAQLAEEPPAVTLAGQLTARVEILATAAARFRLTIDRPLAIASESVAFTSERATVLDVSVDGATHSAALALALGATTARVDELALDLPAATAIAMAIPNQPLTLTHVGLGDRTTVVAVAGRPAIAIDLDPDDGRALAASLQRDGTLAIEPRLDLRTAIDHDALGDEPPIYDVTRLVVDGKIRSTAGRIAVLAGTVAVTTNPADHGVTATSGQCLAPITAEDAGTGLRYEQWQVSTCP